MFKTEGRRGGEVRGIRIKGRRDESSGKRGTDGVINIKGVRFNVKRRCLNIDREIRPTDGA